MPRDDFAKGGAFINTAVYGNFFLALRASTNGELSMLALGSVFPLSLWLFEKFPSVFRAM